MARKMKSQCESSRIMDIEGGREGEESGEKLKTFLLPESTETENGNGCDRERAQGEGRGPDMETGS